MLFCNLNAYKMWPYIYEGWPLVGVGVGVGVRNYCIVLLAKYRIQLLSRWRTNAFFEMPSIVMFSYSSGLRWHLCLLLMLWPGCRGLWVWQLLLQAQVCIFICLHSGMRSEVCRQLFCSNSASNCLSISGIILHVLKLAS